MKNNVIEKNDKNPAEFQLQMAWNRAPKSKTYLSKDKKEIKIIFPGIWNKCKGPDFKDAKIMIDGQVRHGDVETHLKSSDWFCHGHDSDPEYSNVILHVIASDDDASGKIGIPHLVMRPAVSRAKPSATQEFPNGPCVKYFSGFADREIFDFLVAAGIERFKIKTEAAMEDVLAKGADKAMMLRIFEAFGYNRNTENFIELYRRFSDYETSNLDELTAILWGESGLLPDSSSDKLSPELKDFFEQIWKTWWKIRIEDRKRIKWIYSGVRPVNMPERRLAGLCVLIGKIGTNPSEKICDISKKNSSAQDFSALLESLLVCDDPIWNKYLIKGALKEPGSVLGKSRGADIIVNSILPVLSALARVRSDLRLEELCLKTFLSMKPLQPNSVTKLASCRWFMPPARGKNIILSAAASQGMIHIFKSYCLKCAHDCSQCSLIGLESKAEK